MADKIRQWIHSLSKESKPEIQPVHVHVSVRRRRRRGLNRFRPLRDPIKASVTITSSLRLRNLQNKRTKHPNPKFAQLLFLFIFSISVYSSLRSIALLNPGFKSCEEGSGRRCHFEFLSVENDCRSEFVSRNGDNL